MTKPPCYKCQKRQSGCHATCELYISWKAEYEEAANKLRKDNEITRMLWKNDVASKKRSFATIYLEEHDD